MIPVVFACGLSPSPAWGPSWQAWRGCAQSWGQQCWEGARSFGWLDAEDSRSVGGRC